MLLRFKGNGGRIIDNEPATAATPLGIALHVEIHSSENSAPSLQRCPRPFFLAQVCLISKVRHRYPPRRVHLILLRTGDMKKTWRSFLLPMCGPCLVISHPDVAPDQLSPPLAGIGRQWGSSSAYQHVNRRLHTGGLKRLLRVPPRPLQPKLSRGGCL